MTETKTTTVTVDADTLIEVIGTDRPADILRVLGIDLHQAAADLSAAAEWQCGVEGKWWRIEAHQLALSPCYAVRWTRTAEAGIDDIEIVERVDDEDDASTLREWLHEIAAGVGGGNVRDAD